GENFRLVIQSLNRYGNTIYIDDVSYSWVSGSGIESNASNIEVSAYPNPFSENLFIDLPDDSGYSFEIFNAFGEKFGFGVFDNAHSDMTQHFANLASGVYFIKVYGNNGCKTLKVVKER
ncbi:MAG: T9SS type A sorting domain-containing protein, partial [Bacteroidales bacterium]|nr:T9SS type A sorting domain-containing protein [Bacteroidales bacterium]